MPPQPRWDHFYNIDLRGDSRFATTLPSLFPMRFILVQSLDGAANGRCLVQPRRFYLFICTARRFLIFVREYRQTFYCSEDHLDWDPHRESQIELRGGRCVRSLQMRRQRQHQKQQQLTQKRQQKHQLNEVGWGGVGRTVLLP